MSVRTRIVLGVLLIGAVTSWFSVRWVLDDLRPSYLKTVEESLVETARVLAELAAIESRDGRPDTALLREAIGGAGRRRFEARIYDAVKTTIDARVYVTDRRGTVVYDSDGGRDEGKDYSRWNDVYLTLQGRYGVRTTRVNPADPESSILYVASPVVVAGETVGVLTVAQPTRSVNLTIRADRRRLVSAGVAGVAAMLGLGVALSLWVTWPLRRLTAYADAVRDGRRAPLPRLGTFSQWGHSEVGTLGRAVEGMREALEGRRHLERTVLALTHALKGPLAAVRGAADLIDERMPPGDRERFLANIRTEAARIEQTVQGMLDLAAVESRREPRTPERIDLAAVARGVAEEVGPRLEGRGIALSVEAPGGAVECRGERALIRMALLNLVENAADFTPAGGAVRIVVERGGAGAAVRVEDGGPGIPAYALERVFERFYTLPRPDTGRKGSGLGLSIVREIAQLHGGTATLRNREGGGAVAELVFPAYTGKN